MAAQMKPIALNHGRLFTPDKNMITLHCPACYHRMQLNQTTCKNCGQKLTSKKYVS